MSFRMDEKSDMRGVGGGGHALGGARAPVLNALAVPPAGLGRELSSSGSGTRLLHTLGA
jgi:hypothetical protein